MAKANKRNIRPALSPESRENQAIASAYNLALQQLEDGTASSQVITHFLKLGTAKAELERERMIQENKLIQAKTEALESQKRSEELFNKAITAMRGYQGYGDEVDKDEY